MKKLFLSIVILTSIISVNAQLKVESDGAVLIGSKMHLECGPSYSHFYVNSSQSQGLKFLNSTGKMYSYSSSSPSFISTSTSSTQKHLCVMDPSGYFKFWVLGNGSVYAINTYITSDSTKKKDVEPIIDAIDKVRKIKGVTYNLKDNSEHPHSSLWENVETGMPLDGESSPEDRNAGVFSQDVKKVLPEAVRTLEDGSEVVSYNDLVALLIEAVKEQQIQIEELQSLYSSETSKQTKSASVTTVSRDDLFDDSGPILYQNTPNPFTENTEIRYFISNEVETATLYVYNMQGSQIKSLQLHGRGEDSVVISGSELQAGMFIYALVADGREIDLKRMILTD